MTFDPFLSKIAGHKAAKSHAPRGMSPTSLRGTGVFLGPGDMAKAAHMVVYRPADTPEGHALFEKQAESNRLAAQQGSRVFDFIQGQIGNAVSPYCTDGLALRKML